MAIHNAWVREQVLTEQFKLCAVNQYIFILPAVFYQNQEINLGQVVCEPIGISWNFQSKKL